MVYVRHQISVTSTVRKETQVWGVSFLIHLCVWGGARGGNFICLVTHSTQFGAGMGGDIFNSPVCVGGGGKGGGN